MDIQISERLGAIALSPRTMLMLDSVRDRQIVLHAMK
jgi:hypothetical protein